MARLKDINIPAGFVYNFTKDRYEREDGAWLKIAEDNHTVTTSWGHTYNGLNIELLEGPKVDPIEAEIRRRGLTAPRVEPKDVDAAIDGVEYIRRGTLTICVVKLKNGFTVTGESACADPKNFNEELGNKLALGKAKDKIWPLLGYALREKLSNEEKQS
jgi:hypothetical protein